MPVLTPTRDLGWGWSPEGRTIKARADNVMVGLERYMRRFPDAEDVRIVVSRKDEATLGFVLRKLTTVPVVTLEGPDTVQGMIFFRAAESKEDQST